MKADGKGGSLSRMARSLMWPHLCFAPPVCVPGTAGGLGRWPGRGAVSGVQEQATQPHPSCGQAPSCSHSCVQSHMGAQPCHPAHPRPPGGRAPPRSRGLSAGETRGAHRAAPGSAPAGTGAAPFRSRRSGSQEKGRRGKQMGRGAGGRSGGGQVAMAAASQQDQREYPHATKPLPPWGERASLGGKSCQNRPCGRCIALPPDEAGSLRQAAAACRLPRLRPSPLHTPSQAPNRPPTWLLLLQSG